MSEFCIYIYDIDKDTWENGPDLPENKAGCAYAAIDKKLYVIGNIYIKRGKDYVLDTTNNTWATISLFPGSSDGAMPPMIGFQKYILVFGGFLSFWNPSSDIWLYDTEADQWKKIGAMKKARGLTSIAITGQAYGKSLVYVMGGAPASVNRDPYDFVEVFGL